MSKFFGFRVGKPTNQAMILQEDVQITRATLVWKNSADENKTAMVILRQGGNNFVLCTLFPKPGYCQAPLDIRIEKEEKFAFACTNHNAFTVHLTGYTVPSPEVTGEEVILPTPPSETEAENPPPSSATEGENPGQAVDPRDPIFGDIFVIDEEDI